MKYGHFIFLFLISLNSNGAIRRRVKLFTQFNLKGILLPNALLNDNKKALQHEEHNTRLSEMKDRNFCHECLATCDTLFPSNISGTEKCKPHSDLSPHLCVGRRYFNDEYKTKCREKCQVNVQEKGCVFEPTAIRIVTRIRELGEQLQNVLSSPSAKEHLSSPPAGQCILFKDKDGFDACGINHGVHAQCKMYVCLDEFCTDGTSEPTTVDN